MNDDSIKILFFTVQAIAAQTADHRLAKFALDEIGRIQERDKKFHAEAMRQTLCQQAAA